MSEMRFCETCKIYWFGSHTCNSNAIKLLYCYCGKQFLANDGIKTPVSQKMYCAECPPEPCEGCGGSNNAAQSCSCWTSLSEMAMADVKALFAKEDLSIDLVRRNEKK